MAIVPLEQVFAADIGADAGSASRLLCADWHSAAFLCSFLNDPGGGPIR